MNLEKLEEAVRAIVAEIDQSEFVYQLLRAYDQPKASITRLKNGQYNQSKNDGEVLWKKKLCFRQEPDGDLHGCIDRLKSDKNVTKHAPRFIIVTDFETLLALDTKTDDTLHSPIKDLADHFDFFLPWAGMEKSQIQSESLADIKAAEKMGRLYEMILADNDVKTDEDRHALNIFLSRLLFCFFAEDTEIFASDQFTKGIDSHTAEDGSDLQGYLQKLFAVLATEDRKAFPEFLRKFPYVNGGLFCDDYPVPVFNRKSRKIIIECGTLNWKAINPDIFGSMIQAVVHSEERGRMGMHYTSVVNIMKVIEPLFLNELKEQLDAAGNSKKKLDALLNRLYNLRIFDPACGSGNFLIIAYKELCRLEIEIFNRLGQSETGVQMDLFRSNIQLTQFYGIELDDFAHETAKLSLWLAEHQMNLEFKSVFGATRPTLPLQEGGNIVCGNATREDWEEVCPKEKSDEIYILGNPPYLGARNQGSAQKDDVKKVLGNVSGYNNLDYIACWFHRAADLIRNGHSEGAAFVSTNSLCQGNQVALLWPHILDGLEISFAHRSFPWTNNARGNAGVTCVIVGLRNANSNRDALLWSSNGIVTSVANINPYLVAAKNVFVSSRRNLLTSVPPVAFGSMANDGGYLVLSASEKAELLERHPKSKNVIRRFVGSREFINGIERYCLWIDEDQLELASQIDTVADRIREVKRHRESSTRSATNALASVPYRFAEVRHKDGTSLVIPKVSSKRRKYIPIGFLNEQTIISDLAFAVYSCEAYMFSLLSSRMHTIWVFAVGGRLKTDPRYSSSLCYNTFPFPHTSKSQKAELDEHVFTVLDAREEFPERTLADLYDPDKMPDSLREAHHQMDLAVERCYRKKPFSSDEERLEYLFKLYETMIEEEKKGN